MKQREVEVILKNKGFERGVRDVLMSLVEEQNDVRAILNEAIGAISSMASTIVTLNTVADGMKNKIDRLARTDDDVRSTQVIAEGD